MVEQPIDEGITGGSGVERTKAMADFDTYTDAFPHAKLTRSQEGVREVVGGGGLWRANCRWSGGRQKKLLRAIVDDEASRDTPGRSSPGGGRVCRRRSGAAHALALVAIATAPPRCLDTEAASRRRREPRLWASAGRTLCR